MMKKKKKKEAPPKKSGGRISGEAPRGFRMLIRERADGRWVWELKRWTTRLAEGDEATEKEAKQVLAAEMAKRMMAAKERQMQRGELLQRLRYWLERRTYVVMHVLYSLENNTNKGDVVSTARDEERALWKKDKQRGIALPLPKDHHRTKTADDVAGLCFDYCVQLGLVGKEAMRWGTKMMGRSFSHPDAEDLFEVERLEKASDKEEDAVVEDEDDDVGVATEEDADEG